MGFVSSDIKSQRFWVFVFVAGLITGLILRFYLAGFARMPGHGDSAFYFTVAKNIAEGRGPVVDYVTYFFSGLLPLPHYAGDFWNPSASFLIAIPMILFGSNISNALIAPIAAGIVPAVAGFLAGKKYSQSLAIGALAGFLTFLSPFQVWFSVTTEAIIFAGAFGAIAIYFMMKANESPRYFLAAAVFTGFANLIRQDTILLLATLEVCILVATLSPKTKVVIAAAALGIHILILSPLLAKNYVEFHTAFPPGPAKTAFLTTYEDFHSYNKQIDWYTLRATWGIQGILKRRLHTASENLGQVEYFLTPVYSVLVILALIDLIFLHRNGTKLRLLLPAALFALFEYLFYSFIASFSGPGSLIKSLGTLMPFICILIVDFFSNYLRLKPLLIGAVLMLSVYSGYAGFQKNYSSTIYYNGVYDQYKTVKAVILDDAKEQGLKSQDIVVLARDTWDVSEGTGFKAVMVPNNDINTILFVAQHYGAHYLLLPAQRPQLDKIYTGSGPDPRFHFVAVIPNSDMKIFFIRFQ
jgi:Dolichyl-phosphate-mannose-protein mannosyltransferase